MAKKKDFKKDNLVEDLAKLKEQVRELKFSKLNSKSKNTKEQKNLKKTIARMLTELNKNNKNK